MKKIFTLLMLAFVAMTMHAQVMLEEYFNYTANSAIEGQGGWQVSTKPNEATGSSPIVVDQTITYTDYDGSAKGKALLLDNEKQNVTDSRNTLVPFTSDKPATDDVFYAAFLADFSNTATTGGKEIFCYIKQGTTTGTGTTARGRVQVKIADGKKSFAIRKNGQEITDWSAETPKEDAALLVVKYVNKSSGSSEAADEFYLYVNPDPSKSEADNASVMMEALGNTSDGGADLRYVCFRQTKLTAAYAGLRVAKTWADAVKYTPSTPLEDPTTTFSQPTIAFKQSGTATSQTVNTNSDGAITYESGNTDIVTVDASTGQLTAVNPGKTTITAKTAISSSYSASSASYTVYVLSDGDGTLENPYLPTDFRYLAETAEEESTEKAWVVGYIVGVYNSEVKDVKIVNSTTGTSSSIGLGNAANEAVGSNCLTVQLISETNPRTDLNLKDNPTKLKEKVWVYGKIGSFTSSEQTVYGLCHADNYSLDGVTIVPEMTSVTNITVDDLKADGKIYNLSGMEVKTPAKGVYIQNGKKFVVK